MSSDKTSWARLVLVGAIALFLALTLEQLLWVIAYPLSLIFGAVVIAQGVTPVVDKLTRWLPRALAAVLFYLTLLLAGAASVWIVVPALVAQAEQLFAEMPAIEASLRTLADERSAIDLDQLGDAAADYLQQFSGQLVRLPMIVIPSLTNVILVLFLSLYWTIAQPQLRGWVLGLIPDTHRDKFRDVLSEAGGTIGGYVRGVIISALVIGVFTYVGLRVIGVPTPLALAVLAGSGALIPVLGPFISAIPALAVALLSGGSDFLLVLAFYIGLQQVESNILLPVIMRGQARIPPLLSLVAFLIGAAVGGILGALIAIPLFGALRVITVRLLVPAERGIVGVSRAEADAVHHEEVVRDTTENEGG